MQCYYTTTIGRVHAHTYNKKWLDIADEFSNIWNFPNCVRAIDGKHVVITAPEKQWLDVL
jgi:hypothetical protein